MRKIKRVAVLIMIICAFATSVACDVKHEENASSDPVLVTRNIGLTKAIYEIGAKNRTEAEDMVIKYLTRIQNGNAENYGLIWDECLSSVTKEAGCYSKEGIVKELEEKAKGGYRLKNFTIIDSKKVGQGLYTVTFTYKQLEGGVETEGNADILVMDDGEKLGVVYKGLLGYERGNAIGDCKLEIKNVRVLKYCDRCVVTLELFNSTSGTVNLGNSEEHAIVTYISDAGTVTTEIDEIIKLEIGQNAKIHVTFKGKNLEPAVGLKIHNIFEITKDKSGNTETKVLTGRYIIQ